jgi:hypothetical protein
MLNRRGWEFEGTIPFNRYALWRKRSFPAPKRLTSGRSSWRGSSIVTGTHDGGPCANASATVAPSSVPHILSSRLVSTSADPARAHAPPLNVIPFAVQEANEFMQNMKPITWDDMLANAQNLRIHECIKITPAFIADNVTHKPNRTRITSTHGACWHQPRGPGPVEPGLLAGDARCSPTSSW